MPPQSSDEPTSGTPTPSAPDDRRPTPRAALPRRAQMWVMLGLATALLGIVLISGNPTPDPRPAAPAATPTAADSQRITGYQQQLGLRERELARQMAELRQQQNAEPATDPDAQDEAPQRDPLEDDERRREHESRFASSVVLSHRPNRTNGAGTAAAAPTSADARVTSDPTLQALEAQARDSLGRLTASVATLERAGTAPATTPAPIAPPTPPVASTGSPEPTPPAHTPAIRPGGTSHRVLEGTVLETVLMTRLDGDFTGPLMALVTTPLFSHHGEALLVPAGSKVLGRAKAVDTWGQRRLAVSFHRLVLPDGTTYGLDRFTGLNQVGDAGLKDKVNSHYLSTFGAAAAIGLVSGLAQYLSAGALADGGGSGDRTVIITGAGADSAAQAAAQVLQRYTNRLPSITIREGHRCKVHVTQDLELPAYRDVRRTPGFSSPGAW